MIYTITVKNEDGAETYKKFNIEDYGEVDLADFGSDIVRMITSLGEVTKF